MSKTFNILSQKYKFWIPQGRVDTILLTLFCDLIPRFITGFCQHMTSVCVCLMCSLCKTCRSL